MTTSFARQQARELRREAKQLGEMGFHAFAAEKEAEADLFDQAADGSEDTSEVS